MLSLLTILTTTAGTIEVQATLPVEVHIDGAEVLQTSGPATVSLPGVAAGERHLVVHRGGHAESLTLTVPQDGVVVMRIGDDSITTDDQVQLERGPAPAVSLISADGNTFSIILDGQRVGTLSTASPLALEGLTAHHTLEIRSADLQVIWTKGALELQPGDDLVLRVSQGRMPEVFGRADAWKPGA